MLLHRYHWHRNPVIGKPENFNRIVLPTTIYNIKHVFHIRAFIATLALSTWTHKEGNLFSSRVATWHEKPPKPSKILQSVVVPASPDPETILVPSIYPSARSYDCRIISRSRVKQAHASQSWIDGSKCEGGGSWMKGWREREREGGRVGGEGKTVFFRQGSLGRSIGGASHTRHLCGNKRGEGGRGSPSSRRACAIFIARTTPACYNPPTRSLSQSSGPDNRLRKRTNPV